MANLGYRTFGIGKFHTVPYYQDLGYETFLVSEDHYEFGKDAYADWMRKEHPEFNFLNDYHGDRRDAYMVPQVRPLPAESTTEWWTAERAVENISKDDDRPFFGFVSFVGPHPPFAPPVPFHWLYDPEEMEGPVYGRPEVDLSDDDIDYWREVLFMQDSNPYQDRILKARYYGAVTFVDHCIGLVLDALEQRSDARNTLEKALHGNHLKTFEFRKRPGQRSWWKKAFPDMFPENPEAIIQKWRDSRQEPARG